MLNIENKYASGRRPALRKITAACLMLCFSAATIADNTSGKPAPAQAYTDSVNSWGTWELGIEPAAGPQAVTSHAIAMRVANVQFRPNDNATYRPNAVEINANMPMPSNPPAPIPTIPPGTAQGEVGAAPPNGDPRYR